ncbi:MAG: hypothetical protein ACKOW9_02255 [Candidatus Paceibacterota bacterium]
MLMNFLDWVDETLDIQAIGPLVAMSTVLILAILGATGVIK